MKVNNSVKILLVDDLPENLFALELILASKNYFFVRANSGNEALKILLHEQDFAIILMDVQMPEMDGFETVELIREIETLNHVPIIFLTASMDNAKHIFKGYQAGAVDYMIKPLIPEILTAKVAVFVDLYQKTHQLLAQNEEKEKYAEELRIANKNLLFQIDEKEKREAELVIANKEMSYQNEEKVKRADELIIANKIISDYKYALDESAIVGSTDQKGIINYANENFCRISKYSREELIGQDHRIINSGHHPKEFIQNLWATIKSGKVWKGEIKNKAKDGSLYWVDSTIIPILNNMGKPYQYIAMRIDITFQKEMQEKLAFENEEKEKRAAELSIANTELAFQNDEKEKRAAELGVANKALIFQNAEEEKRAAELIVANMELAFQNLEKEKRAAELLIANTELAYQNQEKENRAAELSIANTELAFQNAEKEKRAAELGIANEELIFQNAEKEKRAAELIVANMEMAFQNLEKEKRAAELLIANTELAYQNQEKENRAAELSVANTELAFQNVEKEKRSSELGIANEALIFQNAEKEKRAAELIVVNKELILKSEEKQQLFLNNRKKQKENKILESTLSDLKAAQSLLIQSEKMASLGELAAGIAHEIQNPLNFVNNFSEVSSELIEDMNQEIDLGNMDEVRLIAKDLKENLEKIIDHGNRADAIVKGMLQHSRSNASEKEATNLNALADEYLRLAYHGLRAKDKSFNATMKTDFDESIGEISIIPQDVGRVILNLIINAFYAVSEKKKEEGKGFEPLVSVATKKAGKRILISVKDNGKGILPHVLDKIFQPFFTTKPAGQGTGLGLSLSYDIVKAHGGELKVNTKVGEGTEFQVLLVL